MQVDCHLDYRANPFLHLDSVIRSDYSMNLLKALASPSQHLKMEKEYFERELRNITQLPNARWIDMALTGSDANNMIFDVMKVRNDSHHKVIVLDALWLSQRGALSSASCMHKSQRTDSCSIFQNIHKVKAPWHRTDGTMKQLHNLSPLSGRERKSLEEIENLLNVDSHIGAIIIEIMTSNALQILSASFLRELQMLCRGRKILLMVDEIITFATTNKPFLSQQVVGFIPDIISVGKAFQICGLIQVNDDREYRSHLRHMITQPFVPILIWKPLVVWHYILSHNLLQRSFDVSERLRKRLRKENKNLCIKGVGTILHRPTNVGLINARDSYNRIFVAMDADDAVYDSLRLI
jgi:4-aminobutyrate aminotransferase-like enzyme